MFLSTVFCSFVMSFPSIMLRSRNIHSMLVKNGVFSYLFGTQEVDLPPYGNYHNWFMNKEWDYDTYFYATFDGHLRAGNVDYMLEQVSSMVIRRRRAGTHNWITLFEIPIVVAEDFNFECFDKYARGNTTYEYAIVPIFGNTEGGLTVATVDSKFEGLYIMEKDKSFSTELEVDISVERNSPKTHVTTLGRKYPYYVANSINSYDTGQVSGVFIEKTDGRYVDNPEYKWKYGDSVLEFLSNGNTKLIKNDDGRMWLVGITDTVSEKVDGIPDKKVISFNWVEIGDCESGDDLYENSLLDVDPNLTYSEYDDQYPPIH